MMKNKTTKRGGWEPVRKKWSEESSETGVDWIRGEKSGWGCSFLCLQSRELNSKTSLALHLLGQCFAMAQAWPQPRKHGLWANWSIRFKHQRAGAETLTFVSRGNKKKAKPLYYKPKIWFFLVKCINLFWEIMCLYFPYVNTGETFWSFCFMLYKILTLFI